MLSVDEPQLSRYRRTEIAPVCGVAVVAETPHQLGPCRGDALHRPRIDGGTGKPEPRDSRHDDIEGVGRLAAVGDRVDQRADDVEKLNDRSGPAMSEQQGKR